MFSSAIVGIILGRDHNSPFFGYRWEGKHVTSHSKPSELGRYLYESCFDQFDGNIQYMLNFLLYSPFAEVGWSDLYNKCFLFNPVNPVEYRHYRDAAKNDFEICFVNSLSIYWPNPPNSPTTFTYDSWPKGRDTQIDFIYLFDVLEKTMVVIKCSVNHENISAPSLYKNVVISLDSYNPTIDWEDFN